MKHLATASLIALVAAAAPLSAQTAPGDFRLPTPTPTPTDIQGPVDPDAPILTRPRDTTPTPRPTATPTPTPTPRPTATATPRPLLPPRNSSLPPRFTPPAAPTPRESEAVVTGGATAFPGAPAGVDTSVPALPSTASEPASATPGSDDNSLPPWLLALGGLIVALAAGGAIAWRWRRRRAALETPEIEPPLIARQPSASPVAEPPLAVVAAPLAIEARAVRLSRSMLFATLSYELVATNRGGQPLDNVRLGADLVTAHARIPTDQQLADPLIALEAVKTLDRLEPGESVEFAGELRLPVKDIRPISHGKAVVYVPLLRVRAEADGLIAIARTFVVGLRTDSLSKRLQPFRLDEMPQTYHAVSQLALD